MLGKVSLPPGVGMVDGVSLADVGPGEDGDHVVVGEGEAGVLVAAVHHCIIMAAAGKMPEIVSPAPEGQSSKQFVSKIPQRLWIISSCASCKDKLYFVSLNSFLV